MIYHIGTYISLTKSSWFIVYQFFCYLVCNYAYTIIGWHFKFPLQHQQIVSHNPNGLLPGFTATKYHMIKIIKSFHMDFYPQCYANSVCCMHMLTLYIHLHYITYLYNYDRVLESLEFSISKLWFFWENWR